MTQIISVRIEDDLYEQLKKYDLNVSDLIRRSLKKEVLAMEREILAKKIQNLSEKFKGESLGNFLMVNKKRSD